MKRIDYARQLIAFNGGRPFRAAERLANGKTTPGWPEIRGPTSHWHLRAVLPQEIVFDIGDDDPWPVARKWATAIHNALTFLDLPHWVALSGGKGIHIHLMCQRHAWAEDDEWRVRVSRYVLEYASVLCEDPMLKVDHRLINPREGSRLVRDFGAAKEAGGDRKTLWWQDGEAWIDLPETREQAYSMMRRDDYPTMRPAKISRLDLGWTDAVGAASCPKGPECLDPLNWNFCDTCEVCA